MAKIPEDIIRTIEERADIVEVAYDLFGHYSQDNRGGLRKTGVRYTAICPFHDDQHAGNFIIYPKGNCFRCFACDAKGGAVQLVMKVEGLSFPDAIRWLGKKYGIPVDNVPVDYVAKPARPIPPPLPTLTLPMWMVDGRADTTNDTLCKWIRTGIRWDTCQRHRIEDVLKDYHVGHGKDGHTVFWQIDNNQQVRTGKMMLYRPDGHRDKVSRYNFDWIHSRLIRHYDKEHKCMTTDPPYPYPLIYNPDKQEMRQTLFGMHLLDRYKRDNVEQTVCIVESEKTALLMAIAYGNHTGQVWMACGGVENLSRERLAPILDQHRRIILYPDRDGADRWKDKARQIGYDRMIVDTTPVMKWWQQGDGEKADIADVVIRMLNSQDTPATTVGDIIDNNITSTR